MRLVVYLTALCSLFSCSIVYAREHPIGWSGNVQLGGVQTTGNTNSSTANGKFKLRYLRLPWKNITHFSGIYSSTNGTTNTQSLEALNKTRYLFTKHYYVFGLLNAQDVRFSGYNYQVSEVVGVGRRLYDSPSQTLDADVGFGARQSQLTGGKTSSVGISRFDLNYEFEITQNSEFDQHLSIESGVNNTLVKSVSSLKTTIYGPLSANLSYKIQHNSNVPTDTRKTDTISAVTLEYDF